MSNPNDVAPKVVVIYHLNCFDGFIAACVVKHAVNEDIEFVPMEYGLLPPTEQLLKLVAGKRVYVVDFSLPPDITELLLQVAQRIVMIDHHKSALKAWENHSLTKYVSEQRLELVFDTECSGAKLAHHYAYNNSSKYASSTAWQFMSPWVYAANDYDLWKFEHPDTRAIAEYFYALPYCGDNDFDGFYKSGLLTTSPYLVDEAGNKTDFVKRGEAVIEYKKTAIRNTYAHYGSMMRLDGFCVPVINVPRGWQSMAADVMSEFHPSALFNVSTFVDFNAGVRYYSLRATRGMKFDVSEIAKKFGGGGHAKAAGFKIKFYPNPTIIDPKIESIPAELGFLKAIAKAALHHLRPFCKLVKK